ncbi:MAG: toxin-antitoxin system YwqK family antitoxin [Flavobacteriia bacterium]|jgi:antitoxin component YwqK of YwqJK toxin-antitoxin module
MMKSIFIISILFCTSSFSQNPINAQFKGESEGKHVNTNVDGKTSQEYTILNGNLNGECIEYYSNGNIKLKQVFDKGEYNGFNYHLKKNGDTIYTELFKHDTLFASKNNVHYKSGKLKSSFYIVYINDSSIIKFDFHEVKTLRFATYHNIFSLETKCNNTGIYISYYRNGKMKCYLETKKAIDHGRYLGYFKNGNKKNEYNNIEGKTEGEYLEYYSTGELKFKAFYKNNKLNGYSFKYDKQGKVIKCRNYKDGKRIN